MLNFHYSFLQDRPIKLRINIIICKNLTVNLKELYKNYKLLEKTLIIETFP